MSNAPDRVPVFADELHGLLSYLPNCCTNRLPAACPAVDVHKPSDPPCVIGLDPRSLPVHIHRLRQSISVRLRADSRHSSACGIVCEYSTGALESQDPAGDQMRSLVSCVLQARTHSKTELCGLAGGQHQTPLARDDRVSPDLGRLIGVLGIVAHHHATASLARMRNSAFERSWSMRPSENAILKAREAITAAGRVGCAFASSHAFSWFSQ